MFIFRVIPKHVTPQIDHLRKTSNVLRVHLFLESEKQALFSKKIGWYIFIFRVNLGMWPLKSMVSENLALFWGFQHTFISFLRR